MARTIKLPKRIGGMKIPKSLRKGPVGSFVSSPAGQILIAEAVFVMGGALIAKGSDPDSRFGRAVRHPISGLRESRMAEGTERIANAMGEAIRAFRAALERPIVEPREDGIVAAEETGSPVEGRKKKLPDSLSEATTPH